MYIAKKKLCTKNLIVYTQYSRKFVQKYKNLLCIYSTVETLYKNSAVEMLHLIDLLFSVFFPDSSITPK